MTTMTKKALLTEAETAKRIGWSHSNLRSRRRQRDQSGEDVAPAHRWIAGGRHGGRYYYDPAEIDAWLGRHPEIGEKLETLRDTLSQDEVCEALDLSRTALRARRAKFRAGDASAAPPHSLAGQEIRYSARDVLEWSERVAWDLRPIGGTELRDLVAASEEA